MRRIAKRLAAGLGLLLLGVAGYLAVALVCACIPLNRQFQSLPGGVPIWVACGDIHTDLVMPVLNSLHDWRSELGGPSGAEMVSIGWGDRKVYLETPTWADARVSTIAGAACGVHPTALHVAWLRQSLQAGPRCRSLSLSPDQYSRLCAFIDDTFQRSQDSSVICIPGSGYWDNDAFYEARGHYSALHTCNTWAGEALAAGGVRVAVWTPLPWGVLWQL